MSTRPERISTEWCDCGPKEENAFFAIWDPVGRTNSNVFVHACCGRPSKPIWENNITGCWECLSDFSAPPWQETCSRCQAHLAASGDVDGPYRGWLTTGQYLPDWLVQHRLEKLKKSAGIT